MLHALLARYKKGAQTADIDAVDPASLRPVAELMIPLWGKFILMAPIFLVLLASSIQQPERGKSCPALPDFDIILL
jgi:hypothetical protein